MIPDTEIIPTSCTNTEYINLLKHIGSILVGGWNLPDTLNSVYSTEVLATLNSKKIHKYQLYSDITWYIVQHTNKNIEKLKKMSSKYFLIEVNGEICEDSTHAELEDILNQQGYGGSTGKERITKRYYEVLDLIRNSKI